MKINERDNVEVNLENGHKYAVKDIAAGEYIIKYGCPIGHASEAIKTGEWVHTHNLKTNLDGVLNYSYKPHICRVPAAPERNSFMGFLRKDGNAGIRNDLWIINTVGCVNKLAERLAAQSGAKHFPHPFGCSQLGGDQRVTQQILKGMVQHPNAGGVLVLGLGCENNHLGVFREILGEIDENRVKFLNAQDCGDEIGEGLRLLEELDNFRSRCSRQKLPLSHLRVGLKCGGSDGYSGITANPLVGRASDLLIASGASTILTEVPEMFGAETQLMNRCESRGVFDKCVRMVNGYKEYFLRHDQVVYENPSPGNKAGGITTLEEKSLGCVQKSGFAPVVDVLDYGDTVTKPGLNLLNGPGNDLVAITNLMAAGAQLILFTTGRGTPVGSAVPTLKIATNSVLADKKPHWIDFDAGRLLSGMPMDEAAMQLYSLVLDTAEGRETRNEENGYEEISIFKDGVTL